MAKKRLNTFTNMNARMINMSDKATPNYSLRPGKSIVRKMLCESFGRLSGFGLVKKYRYIGFGSIYFSDFYLFHKNLGFENMISIEKGEKDRKRLEFNKPYKMIEILYGHSNQVLPTLKWDAKTILWLDYTEKLKPRVFTDIKHFFTSAIPGSLFFVTLNANPGDFDVDRVTKLKESLGNDKIPLGLEDKDLATWGTADTYRKIILYEIRSILNARNGTQSPTNKLSFQQLFYLQYADTSKIMILGGILISEGDMSTLNACSFDMLDFYSPSKQAYRIDVPRLTFREARALDKYLPSKSIKKCDVPLTGEEIEQYSKVYRYFPVFAETEL